MKNCCMNVSAINNLKYLSPIVNSKLNLNETKIYLSMLIFTSIFYSHLSNIAIMCAYFSLTQSVNNQTTNVRSYVLMRPRIIRLFLSRWVELFSLPCPSPCSMVHNYIVETGVITCAIKILFICLFLHSSFVSMRGTKERNYNGQNNQIYRDIN